MSSSSTPLGHIDEIGYLDGVAGGTVTALSSIPRGALLTIRGWAASAEDPGSSSGVFAFIDGGPPIEVVYGLERLDVAASLESDAFANTGFRGALSTSHLALGDHRLTVAIRDENGTFARLDRPAEFSIDEPVEQRVLRRQSVSTPTPISVDEVYIGAKTVTQPIQATQDDTVAIRGWAIDEPANDIVSGVFAIVGTSVFRAAYALSRDDVAAHRSDSRFFHSGFRVEIPLASIAPGDYTIAMRAVGIDGKTIYDGPQIALCVAPFTTLGAQSPGGLPTLGAVDTTVVFDISGHIVSKDGPLVLARGQQLLLGGWAIDEPGDALARAVHVCIDDVASTPAVYGVERRDVARHYHRPDLTECGFTAIVSTNAMPAGPHSASVRVIDRTGTRFYEIGGKVEFIIAEPGASA